VPEHDRKGGQSVAADLEEKIRTGEYPVGQRLPSRRRLAEDYGVSESTIWNAVRVLKALRLVKGQQGLGIMVRPVGDWLPAEPEPGSGEP
jgi:DNA-binding GntR family transcriptional regulator